MLSEPRVVLTPGGSATVRIDVEQVSTAVMLEVLGDTGDLEVSLSDESLTEGSATLHLKASDEAKTQDLSLTVEGHQGLEDSEQLEVSIQVPTDPVPGAEQHAPGVEGVVKTLEIDGQELTYEVVNGLALLNGDVVLGKAAELEASVEAQREGIGPRSATCNFDFNTDFNCNRWADGVIGYSFANDWGNAAENERMRGIIEAAITEWESETGIRFVRRAAGEYLEFRNGDGCSSTIGRAVITGLDSQSISLDNDCDTVGVVMHEIGHAVGLYHEQSRDDRDDHVVVDFGRVRDGRLHNFYQWGEYERDRGEYDYGSLMHYARAAFARNPDACNAGDLSECTVRPHDTSANIGQRSSLSEGDILGAYMLYPPEYSIQVVQPGDTDDRYFLSLEYETPTPEASRLVWTSDRVSEPLGTGHQLSLQASEIPEGAHEIAASFIVADTTVIRDSVTIDLSNGVPEVSLEANNGQVEQQLGQPFTVSATVSDAEDGACSPDICDYTWMPAPSGRDDARTANYRFDTEGSQTIRVEVEDRGGAVGADELTVDIVNSAPTVRILRPSSSSVTLSEGAELRLEGEAEDPNMTSGGLACSQLTWSSTNGGDVFSAAPTLCEPILSFSGTGTRTISLVATDAQGLSSEPATIEVTITACDGNCVPTAYFDLTAPDYESTYFIENPMTITMNIGDGDAPADNPMTYRLTAQRSGGSEIVIATGNVNVLDGSTVEQQQIDWTPEDDITGWSDCANANNYRSYDIRLEVSDGTDTTVDTQTVSLGCDLV